MKYSEEEFRKHIIAVYFETSEDDLSEKDKNRVDKFLASYDQELAEKLNERQQRMLYYMYHQQEQNTDHLSFAMGWSRRATINTANALVRRGYLWWDIPTSSNMDMGYDLVIDKMMTLD
ncbi:hypothetical protein VCHA53O466_50209 [Vibrio chagasii]|nr:hypothetical protein VCHA53O466_50209 [Vibrio chagasii]